MIAACSRAPGDGARLIRISYVHEWPRVRILEAAADDDRNPSARVLPWVSEEPPGRPYGARSDQSVVVGELLMRHVPVLARGDLEIVAIARRTGVLSKVAVRRRAGVRLAARPVSLMVGLGADYVHRVSAELGGERIHVVQWQGDPARYIADALGLGYVPPTEVLPSRRLANVLLGDIDVHGARGRQGVNLLLASALTGWRIRLREIARSSAWKALEVARDERRSVPAMVQTRVPKGLAVVIYGLHGLLPTGQVRGVRRRTSQAEVDALLRQRLGQELRVNVLRVEPDTGHIFVSERVPAGYQLRLL
jgi:transcription antitermination factor NusA-like protein